MTSRPLLLLFAFAAACVPEEDLDLVETLPVDQAPAVLANSQDWQTAIELMDYYTYENQTTALYGLAVARLNHRKACTGFMISGDVMVTARDCVMSDWNTRTFDTIYAYFGVVEDDAERARVARIISKRRENAGLLPDSAPDIPSDASYRWGMERAVCGMFATDDNRDIVYLSCHPESGYGYQLGDVWGFLELGIGQRRSGQSGFGVTVTNQCHESSPDILMAGGVTLGSAACEPGRGTGCFEHTMNNVPASKGGPILNFANKVVGVAHGTASLSIRDTVTGQLTPVNPDGAFSALMCPDEQLPGLTLTGRNTGVEFGMGAWHAAVGPRYFYGDPPGDYAGGTTWVGGNGGAEWSLTCPYYQRAVGLVGSEAQNGMVGNLGLICAPRNSHAAYFLSYVHAAGSHDTYYQRPEGMPLNQYMTEVRSFTGAYEGLQTYAICPTNSRLTGIRARGASYVDKVDWLECTMPNGYVWLEPIGGPQRGGIGRSNGGTRKYLRCPQGSEITELIVQAQAWTDGFMAHCSDNP